MTTPETPASGHKGEQKPARNHPGNIHNERKGDNTDSQDIERSNVSDHPEGIKDEELKKTERNPESNPDYVKEQLRQVDA